jgi:hypothetical protein
MSSANRLRAGIVYCPVPIRITLAWLGLIYGFALATGHAKAQSEADQALHDAATAQARFSDYREAHGGQAVFGTAVSGLLRETSETDGKLYIVQYFQTALFEWHPQNSSPYNVLLANLGSIRYKKKYPNGAPDTEPNSPLVGRDFGETHKQVKGEFLSYWNDHGKQNILGLPISNQFSEASDDDNRSYTVQYFERAVLQLRTIRGAGDYVTAIPLARRRYVDLYGTFWDKVRDAPIAYISTFLQDNPGAKILVIPSILAFIAMLFNMISLPETGKHWSREPFLEMSLNLPFLALAVDLTALVDNNRQSGTIVATLVVHLILLAGIVLFIRVSRAADDKPRRVRVTWTLMAVLFGLGSLLASFWLAA